MGTPNSFLPTTCTLGAGLRITTVSVTSTATSLDALMNTAVSGRTSMSTRRVLRLRNLEESASCYIVESASQAASAGWEIDAGGEISFDASDTFTGNNGTDAGFYLITASGTVALQVMEGR